ncbi:unnamed protein product [Caenorhabditis auriculariae]|uniref:Vacuolar protein-sorting-associated protein 25 n=1 Tax=Caenorhabditis auriculariae TaxID=2777116 RepID=A0A8S1HM72_9PELO|nr:unnamed protein product [Caenorhabditis auriculariae]
METDGSVTDSQRAQHIEWIDSSRTRCHIYWRRPEEWGALIYDWAVLNSFLNTPLTLYEITQGDDTTDEAFFGLEKDVLLKALRSLESSRKAQLLNIGSDSEGVKFLQ